MPGRANIAKLEAKHVRCVSGPAGAGYYQSTAVTRGVMRPGCPGGRHQEKTGLECHVRCYGSRCWARASAEGFLTGNNGFTFQKSLCLCDNCI